MSLQWCSEHCPRIHHPKGAQAKNIVDRPYWCPNFPDVTGKCFGHCNLDSSQTCGKCVHWYGHCTTEPVGQPKYNSNGRHARWGFCPYQIEDVTASWKNDCPYYLERPKDFDWAFPDWVEDQIGKEGFDTSAPETRSIRIEMRHRWFEMLGADYPRFT